MRQTNVCLNRVFKFRINFSCIPGAHANSGARKKCAMKSERRKQTKKDKKTMGALYKLSQRSERGRLPLKQGVMDHFIVGDIDSA